MDAYYPYELVCPVCGHASWVELASGIVIRLMPAAREQILNGTFQVFTCPACSRASAVETSAVYTDFERGHYIATESAAGLSWQAALLRHRSIFDDCFVNAPSIARELGRKIKKRMVFGFRALREKLVVWDAELDDYVVEAVKGDLIQGLAMKPAECVLRLSRVLPGGHLLFARFPPTARPGALQGRPLTIALPAAVDYETATAEHYRQRSQRRGEIAADYPWLPDEWLVDIHDGPAYLYQ